MEGFRLVRAWSAAWNDRDAERLATLVDEDVVLDLPRGTTRGRDAVRDFVVRQSYGVRVFVGPHRLHAIGDTIISVGPLELRQIERDDEVVHRDEEAAAAFLLRDERIARFKPYPTVSDALAGENLTAEDLAGAVTEAPPGT